MRCPCLQQECSLRFAHSISISYIYLTYETCTKYLGKLFLQETCLASKDAMPFDLLKKKLLSRLKTMGIQIIKTYEEVKILSLIAFFLMTLHKKCEIYEIHEPLFRGSTLFYNILGT